MARGKYDYETLKQHFIEGMPVNSNDPDGDRDWPNLRELSDRTGVPYVRIRERASKERWIDHRTVHQAELARQRQTKRAEMLSGSAIEFDDKSLDVAKAGQRLISVRLSEIAREVRERAPIREKAIADREQGLPIQREDLWSAIRASEMKQLAESLRTFQEVGMKALGTDIDKHLIEANVSGIVEAQVSVVTELERDDPERLVAFVQAAQRSGVWDQLAIGSGDEEDEDENGEYVEDSDTVEGELVEE